MKMVLDGTGSGMYRGDCECGFNWHGMAEQLPDHFYSPALPVAEASVHHRMCHADVWLNVQFTDRFRGWLEKYWLRMHALNGLGSYTMTR